jgi:hypothetical protein
MANNKPAGNNNATNGRDAFRDSQSDGVKNYSDHHWGPFKPQQVTNKAYRDRQSSGQRGFGKLPADKDWW